MDIYVTSATDIGIKRKVNQDSYFVRRILLGGETLAFAVLCDGMGGLTQGEVAGRKLSRLTATGCTAKKDCRH